MDKVRKTPTRELPVDGLLINDVQAATEDVAEHSGQHHSSLRTVEDRRTKVAEEVRRKAEAMRKKLESFGIRT